MDVLLCSAGPGSQPPGLHLAMVKNGSVLQVGTVVGLSCVIQRSYMYL